MVTLLLGGVLEIRKSEHELLGSQANALRQRRVRVVDKLILRRPQKANLRVRDKRDDPDVSENEK